MMKHFRDRCFARPPTILDGIVIVGAVAIALTMARAWPYPRWWPLPMSMSMFPGTSPSDARSLHQHLGTWISWSIPFGITSTIALLVLHLRLPRPRLRRVARQPGAIACAAAFVTMAASTITSS